MAPEILAARDDLVIRRMGDTDGDYELMVGWRNQPHVRRWWDPDLPPLTVVSARAEYAPDTRPGSESTACIVELEGRPVGFMQFYLWESYADEAEEVGIPFDDRTWGVDVFIGEEDALGRGLGTGMMTLLCDYLEAERNASSIALTTELDNAVAIRCYEKAGFTKVTQVFDLDTRNGERTRDWLMIRGPIPSRPDKSIPGK
jgi:aminoglycoside 6'-N-acetyltransferase